MADTGEERAVRKRIRGYGSRRKAPRFSFIRHPLAGRVIAITMSLVSVAYGCATAVTWYTESMGYAGVPLGGNWQSVQYILGTPNLVRSADGEQWIKTTNPSNYDQWQYQEPFVTVRFNPNSKRAETVYCQNPDFAESSACPESLGVKIGDNEQNVLEMLGTPTYQRISGGKKIMAYSAVGRDVVLERSRVIGVRAFSPEGSFLAVIYRYALWLIP